MKGKLTSKELIIIAGDTLPPQMDALKAGRSHAQVGQRPFEMGYRAPDVLIQLIKGEPVEDPLYTGLDECTQENADTCLANRRRPRALFWGSERAPFTLLGPRCLLVDEGAAAAIHRQLIAILDDAGCICRPRAGIHCGPFGWRNW